MRRGCGRSLRSRSRRRDPRPVPRRLDLRPGQDRHVDPQVRRECARPERGADGDHDEVIRAGPGGCQHAHDDGRGEQPVGDEGQRVQVQLASGVAQRGSRHHGDDHGGDRPERERVQPVRGHGRAAEQRPRLESEADRQPDVAEVQDPHDGHAPRTQRLPLGDAPGLRERGRRRDAARPGRRRAQDVRRRDGDHQPDDHGCEAASCLGHGGAAAQAQRGGGERGHDAAADHGDEDQRDVDGGERRLVCRPCVVTPRRPVEGRLAREQGQQHQQQRRISVSLADQRWREQCGEQREEREIDGRDQCRGRFRGNAGDDAAGQPDGEEDDQGRAGEALATGPARDGREEETGDCRGDEAEDRLVRVPEHRRPGEREGQAGREAERPQRHDDKRDQAGAEEEGTEAVGEQGWHSTGVERRDSSRARMMRVFHRIVQKRTRRRSQRSRTSWLFAAMGCCFASATSLAANRPILCSVQVNPPNLGVRNPQASP